MLSRDDYPIVALCTPSGSGAIGLIRISGNNIRSLLKNISQLYGNQTIEQVAGHTIHAGWLTNKDKKIDQVMFLVMDAPKTFTGQDTIEITCHNNPFIIQEIIDLVIAQGARPAERGEFTLRAFLNKKIDLIQAEAINELITANNQHALKKSLAQLEGSLSNWITNFESDLFKAFAWCQASFEFLDEETEFKDQIKKHLETLLKKLQDLKRSYNSSKNIRNGIKIAILGSVNAGKSSIFNSLLESNRAIVTPIAGTTRDVIEAGLYQYGTYVTYIDTAGLRITEDFIEQEGIKRSYKEAEQADIILLVFDSTRMLTEHEEEIYKNLINLYKNKIIIVSNKHDLNLNYNKHQLSELVNCKTSSKDLESINNLREIIKIKIDNLLKESKSPYLLNKRHFENLAALENKLEKIIALLNNNPQYEIIAFHLMDALEGLSELTGKSVSEVGLDIIFKEFCVGK